MRKKKNKNNTRDRVLYTTAITLEITIIQLSTLFLVLLTYSSNALVSIDSLVLKRSSLRVIIWILSA